MLALALLLTALPLVDPGVRPVVDHPRCAITAVGFRTREEGWLADRCGRLFHTTDAGRSWARDDSLLLPPGAEGRPWVHRIEWLTTQVGLMLPNDARWVWRTADGGKSWTRIPVPLSEGELHLDWVYPRVWLFSTAGLARSGDAGATWMQLDAPGSGGADLAFKDEREGWLQRDDGFWRTDDGGDHWDACEPPLVGQWNELTVARTGWRQPTVGTGPIRSVVLRSGRPTLLLGADGHALTSEFAAAWGAGWIEWGDGSLGASWLIFRENGRIVLEGPPTTAGSVAAPADRVAGRAGKQQWAWRGTDVFRPHGARWVWSGAVAAPIARAVVLNDGALLARLRDGALARCDGQDCQQETRRELQFVFALLTGEDPPPLPANTAYACAAAGGSLRVESAVEGCSGSSSSFLTLDQDRDGATLHFHHRDGRGCLNPAGTRLAPVEADALVRALVVAWSTVPDLAGDVSTVTETVDFGATCPSPFGPPLTLNEADWTPFSSTIFEAPERGVMWAGPEPRHRASAVGRVLDELAAALEDGLVGDCAAR